MNEYYRKKDNSDKADTFINFIEDKMVKEFLNSFFELMNELYNSNLNWYKFFFSNNEMVENISKIFMYIEDNRKYDSDDDIPKGEKIVRFFKNDVKLYACFLQYMLHFVSDFFPTHEKESIKNYKEDFYKTFMRNINEITNINNNGINKELISDGSMWVMVMFYKKYYKTIASQPN